MQQIRVYSWKPSGAINFGDEIGPMIVRKLCELHDLKLEVKATTSRTHSKILAVGSVLHEAQPSDVVWGVGVNSKNRLSLPKSDKLIFRAVRGPLTRTLVHSNGFNCPPIYGDPGLLFPMLFDREIRHRRSEIERSAENLGLEMPDIVVIPNINDDRFLPEFSQSSLNSEKIMVVKPNLDPITVAAYISAAKKVISSSLHGLVFAEAYGKETYRMTSQYEPEFKYNDYYEGTGRIAPPAFSTIESAMNSVPTARLEWDPLPLLTSFPLLDINLSERLITSSFKLKPNEPFFIKDISRDTSPFGSGWAEPSGGSIWMIDTWATFNCELSENLKQSAKLKLRIGTVAKGKGAFEVLRVVYAGKLVTSFKVQRNGDSIEAEIPLPMKLKGEELELSFKVENPSAPKDFGISDDERSLGVWISEFELHN
jgi:hypothetical protein